MTQINLPLCIGSLLGLMAVAFGAYTEHHLKNLISPEMYHSVTLALQYQLIHAILIAVLGVLLRFPLMLPAPRRLKLATSLFILGICAFSFSIQLAALTGDDRFKLLAPAGGSLLMVAWLMLATAAFTHNTARP